MTRSHYNEKNCRLWNSSLNEVKEFDSILDIDLCPCTTHYHQMSAKPAYFLPWAAEIFFFALSIYSFEFFFEFFFTHVF